MLRSIVKTATPLARTMTTAAEQSEITSRGIQRFTRTVEIPTWGFIGLLTAAAGFLGKVLHDDNLATRQELKETNLTTRQEFLSIRQELQALRTDMRQDIADMRKETHQDKAEIWKELKDTRIELTDIKDNLREII